MPRFTNYDDLESLIDITCNYMLENELKDLSGSYSKKSHFFIIAELYFGFIPNEKVIAITNTNLRKLRSEFAHRFTLDNEFRVDCDKVKTFFEFDSPQINKFSISGYVQDIHSDPFGAIFVSEVQVKLWAVVFESDPFWYFDATGGIFKRVNPEKETHLYSIVVHDSINKTNISTADFITNSNNNVSIYSYLYKLIEKFKSNRFFNLPKAIITDFSWDNIHSTMKAFNNLNVIDYLNLTSNC
ncbi:unnamed protein product [Brachionus calyciflorus]|uniref:Uncharacterized protein n=1 Tax=Brachionus calyciflorus TaxID=104777 RepID=A0A814QQE4_9BILA|nr:unnamed protein product [Brachionus calyciflorus]